MRSHFPVSGDSSILNAGWPFSNRDASYNLLPGGGFVLFSMPEFTFTSQLIT